MVVVVVVAFSSRARILGEYSTIHSRLRFFFSFLFFKVEISLRTLIPPFRQGSVHRGSASWDDCDWVFPDELRVSSFPDRFPHYACIAGIVSPLRLRWVKSVCVFRCNLTSALLAKWSGLLRATAVTRGELSAFRSRVRHSNHQTMKGLL